MRTWQSKQNTSEVTSKYALSKGARIACGERIRARLPAPLQISVPAMHAQTLLTQAAAWLAWATGYTPRVALALASILVPKQPAVKDKAGDTQQQQKHAVAPWKQLQPQTL